jgi:glycerol-3-phosphate dehydrogenase
MDRAKSLEQLAVPGEVWDIAIIGGGATGLGVAVDAASRGYRVCLLERDDFAKGTSSRSTKIIHGGVRYLKQGQVSLVRKALRERRLLFNNAPHLVRPLEFIIPTYRWWESAYYSAGMKAYDMLAAGDRLPASTFIDRDNVHSQFPTIQYDTLHGGVCYWDGQFDDARLAITLAATAVEQGAALVNYAAVTGLLKTNNGAVCGLRFCDRETDESREVMAQVVINATGPFTDEIAQLDREQLRIMAPSQGVHLAICRQALPMQAALMIPKTTDGRVLFAIPWQDVIIAGTTDTPLEQASAEPRAQEEEIFFILRTLNQYLDRYISLADIRSVFTGIRPLVGKGGEGTAGLSREHSLWADPTSNLVTITGGKWTTYRQMAEETVDLSATIGRLPSRPCQTASLSLHGKPAEEPDASHSTYGTDAARVQACAEGPAEVIPIHSQLRVTPAEIRFACRAEMARTVDDVLSRRSRSLFVDADAAVAAAPAAASIMANELQRSDEWIQQQVRDFQELAQNYQWKNLLR